MIIDDKVILIEFDPDPEVREWAVYFFVNINLANGTLKAFNGLDERIGYGSLSKCIKAAKAKRAFEIANYEDHKIVVLDSAWSKLDNQLLPFRADQYIVLETEMDEIEAVLKFQ